ncbi:MAG: preprotein translocase subunit SecE [Lachnospiraceae bacterium]|jgi:preprotein translocase subunit SecE|nr:preprotein translocase subunit SecE [Lachnospiraceae bacterium]
MAENNGSAVGTAKKGFFKGIKSEFKKISWPGKSTLIKETTAVVVYSVILGGFIALVDLLIKYGISALGLLGN